MYLTYRRNSMSKNFKKAAHFHIENDVEMNSVANQKRKKLFIYTQKQSRELGVTHVKIIVDGENTCQAKTRMCWSREQERRKKLIKDREKRTNEGLKLETWNIDAGNMDYSSTLKCKYFRLGGNIINL